MRAGSLAINMVLPIEPFHHVRKVLPSVVGVQDQTWRWFTLRHSLAQRPNHEISAGPSARVCEPTLPA